MIDYFIIVFILLGQVQHLYIKLYARKRAWIHLRNIKYQEIDPFGEHKNDLIMLSAQGFLLNCKQNFCFYTLV